MCETPGVEVLGEGLGVGNCRAGWRKPPGNSGVFFTDFVKQCRSKLSVCHPHTSVGVWKRFFSLPAVSPTLGSTVPASQAAFRAPSPAVNTNDSHPDTASHDPGADARAAAVADQRISPPGIPARGPRSDYSCVLTVSLTYGLTRRTSSPVISTLTLLTFG